jgi:hypothetical protein
VRFLFGMMRRSEADYFSRCEVHNDNPTGRRS